MKKLSEFEILKAITVCLMCVFISASPVIMGAQNVADKADIQEHQPVHVIVNNTSSHSVQVHLVSFEIIGATHQVPPKSNLELDVPYGHSVWLEYAPCPNRTKLSQMGSMNELQRTLLLRDDGENIFIQEKFSGSRQKEAKGKSGKKQAKVSPHDIISLPPDQCLEKVAARKADPSQPEGKQPLLKTPATVKTPRKEDPDKPAPKKEEVKKKRSEEELKKKKKKEKEM